MFLIELLMTAQRIVAVGNADTSPARRAQMGAPSLGTFVHDAGTRLPARHNPLPVRSGRRTGPEAFGSNQDTCYTEDWLPICGSGRCARDDSGCRSCVTCAPGGKRHSHHTLLQQIDRYGQENHILHLCQHRDINSTEAGRLSLAVMPETIRYKHKEGRHLCTRIPR
jgi:hypothetical protein